MDAVLVPVTLVSVIAALVSGGLAWRLSREGRRRSEARVALLSAEIAALERGERPSSPTMVDELRHGEVTRPVVEPDRALAPGEPARIPAVAGGTPDPFDLAFAAVTDTSAAHAALFATAQAPPRSSGRLAVVVAIGAAIVGVSIAVVYWINAPTAAGAQGAPAAVAAPADVSLELVSLTHAQQGTDWTITGLVRNPGPGPAVERAAAVAFLFDANGSFVGSGRAPLDVQMLMPGDESPFVVRITAAGRVERYRLSFRAEDGRIVRHQDRRANGPAS